MRSRGLWGNSDLWRALRRWFPLRSGRMRCLLSNARQQHGHVRGGSSRQQAAAGLSTRIHSTRAASSCAGQADSARHTPADDNSDPAARRQETRQRRLGSRLNSARHRPALNRNRAPAPPRRQRLGQFLTKYSLLAVRSWTAFLFWISNPSAARLACVGQSDGRGNGVVARPRHDFARACHFPPGMRSISRSRSASGTNRLSRRRWRLLSRPPTHPVSRQLCSSGSR